MRRQHEVDHGSVRCILPRLGSAEREVIEWPSMSKVNDCDHVTLSTRQNIAISTQLAMTVEVASNHHIKARAVALPRGSYCAVE